MIRAKACKHCGGDLAQEYDEATRTWAWVCVQCRRQLRSLKEHLTLRLLEVERERELVEILHGPALPVYIGKGRWKAKRDWDRIVKAAVRG